jgi:hypothetical protein
MITRFLSACAAVLLLTAAGSAPTAAQELVVTGQVIGPDGSGVSGQRVVLHRVDASGGATIAETLSAETGRFELRAPAVTDTAAVYFVASRYDGELYIGPPFRPGQGEAAEQVVHVGLPEMSATALMSGDQPGLMPMGRPATSRNWLLLVIPLLGVAAVAVYALVPRGRIPHERSLVIRVAELDERMSTAPDAQRESLLAERQRLMAQLREG